MCRIIMVVRYLCYLVKGLACILAIIYSVLTWHCGSPRKLLAPLVTLVVEVRR